MNLFFLRHGIAVELGTAGYRKDADRPLTPKGKRRLRQIAEAMKVMNLSFDLLLSSPYLRAKQTAEIVGEVFRLGKELAFSEDLTPGGNPKFLIEHLNGLEPAPESVLLVGHEPYLSALISTLVAGNTGLAIDLKKGGLCKLEAESLRYGRCATLAWLLTPRQMAAMA